MKRVEKISVGGAPYMIDVDAHVLLSSYLKSLSRKYGNRNENELMIDIESRIAEIVNEKINSQSEVINIEMVRSIISQIGTVSSIEMDSLDTESGVRFDFEPEVDCSQENRGIEEIKKVAQEGIIVVGNVLSRTFKLIVTIVIGIFSFIVGITIIGSLVAAYYYGGADVPLLMFVSFPILGILFFLLLISLLQKLIDGGKSFISRKITTLTIFGLMLLSIGSSVISGIEINSLREFEQESIEVIYIDIEDFEEIVLDVNEAGSSRNDEQFSPRNVSQFRNQGYILIRQYIDIEEDSELDKIKIVITKRSHGSSIGDAHRRAKEFPVIVDVVGDTIRINKYAKLLSKDIMYETDIDIEISYPADKVTLNRVFSSNYEF